MRIASASAAQPVHVDAGCPVFTSDNEALGYAREIRSDAFLVEVPMGADRWIDPHHVRIGDEWEIVLDFPRQALDENSIDADSARPSHD